jgi:predicted esterase
MLAAVRYLKRYAASYKVDPNHVIVMGSSSGAQMALQADFDSETPGTSGNPGYSSNPAGAVAVSWSVLTGMEAGDSPVEVFQALDDPAQPFPLAEGMCTEDQALGNTCVVQIYQDGGHGKDLLAAHGPAVMQQTADFLCRTVLGPKICKVPA